MSITDILDRLPLTRIERRILETLACGRYVTTETLIGVVYGDDPNGGPKTAKSCIEVTVSRLRRTKLAGTGLVIKGHTGAGRRLVLEEHHAQTA